MSAGHNLAAHRDRDELRANYLVALEYGVLGRSHVHDYDRTPGPRGILPRVCRCGEVEQEPAPTVELCPDCAGSGAWAGWDGSDLGTCTRCNGEGIAP